MTLRDHPAGQPTRTRISHLVMLALLACGSATTATAETVGVNMVTDPVFSLGQWRMTPATVIKPFTVRGVPNKNAACIQMTSARKGNDASKPENLIYLPGLEKLGTNKKYRLNYTVRALTDARSGARSGALMASVTATEVVSAGKYYPLVYGEQQVRYNSGSFRTYSLDFVTPVGTARVKPQNRPTEIMFQALSDDDSYAASQFCVTDVQLIPLGDNLEVTLPNDVASKIVYNQVVSGQEIDLSTYFTVINPDIPSTLQFITGSGANEKIVRSQTIWEAPKDVHTGLPVYSYPTYWIAPVKARLVNIRGTVIAETGTINFASSAPYSTYAPNLRRDALHFFYAQRAGQDIIDRRYQDTSYRNWLDRPAGHKNETATCFSGVDNFGNDFAGACKTASGVAMAPRDVSGGWYDAGDQGKYVVNGATALWALQNVIEHHKNKGTLDSAYPDGMLKYGENGRSDLLDEARHEMEWLLKMQINESLIVRVPSGKNFDLASTGAMLDTPANVDVTVGARTYQPKRALIKLSLSDVDANGMAFSAVRDKSWTSIPLAPASDTKARVLDYPTTISTLNLASVAAQSYRIWKDIDPAFADKCLAAAKTAWAAALRNPMVYRYGEYSDGQGVPLRAINEGGGAYSDTDPKDAKAWAALELYLASSSVGGTDSTEAQDYLKAISALSTVGSRNGFTFSSLPYAESFSWKHNKNMGLMSVVVNGRDADFVTKVKTAANRTIESPLTSLKAWAADTLITMNASAFGVPHVTEQPFNWASNADIANSGGMLALAGKYVTFSKYQQPARRVMSYLLGHNPLGKSYITGYGTNPVRNPHHRFWAKHADIAFPSAPPGMLVGGPNGKWEGTVLSAKQNAGVWGWTGDTGADYYVRQIMPSCNYLEPNGIVSASVGSGGISCYQDRYDLYMTNEVAINWNSALFWLSAYLD
jgi:endoglucanase